MATGETTFRHKGIEYTVSGSIALFGADGGGDGMTVQRADGRAIVGARKGEYGYQILPKSLADRARKALLALQKAQFRAANGQGYAAHEKRLMSEKD